MRKIDLEAEANYENRKASGEAVRSSQSKFYWATSIPTDNHRHLSCESIHKQDVLEIGCASGNDATEYAKFAKTYTGVDISDVAISNAQKLELTNCKFYCVDGHKLPVASNSMDFIIVNSLLHHLDLDNVFVEIARVLKDNGSLIFREPLGTNPLFQLYRLLTPSARTVDERPFTFKDLHLMRSYFLFENVRWFGFLSILSAFLRFDIIRGALTKVDDILSHTPLKYFFWQFSGIAKLKKKI
jgi:SAM-dependent methyltransferase